MASRATIASVGLLALLVGPACGLSTVGTGPEAEGEATPTLEQPDRPMLPVSINEGLASLDSYRLTYTTDLYDSVSRERNQTTLVVALDREADASYNRTESRVSGGASEDGSVDVQEQYVIGDQVCLVAEGEAELTTLSEIARVMSDLMSQVVVFEPLIENPVYVRDEVVAGVPVHSYTFELRSVGAASQVEVARSDGSYAIAVDGDYLVHYRLDLELRTAAEGDAEAQSSDLSVELTLEAINQPVDIALPLACQEAASSGE